MFSYLARLFLYVSNKVNGYFYNVPRDDTRIILTEVECSMSEENVSYNI